MRAKKIVELEEAIVEFLGSSIVHVTFKEGAKLDFDLQRKLREVYFEFGYGRINGFMLSSEAFVSTEKTFWDSCKKSERFVKGQMVAVVAPNLADRILASNYQIIYKPKNPYKIFQDCKQALSWLNAEKTQPVLSY
jgi:hypothetical protein